MPGWNDHVRKVRESAMLWNRIWVEAGWAVCPEAGVLFDLRKQTKKAYKYSVRRVKRRQKYIVSEKLSKALLLANNSLFWKDLKKIKSRTKQCNSPVVDGFSDDKVISECFRSKFSGILNCSNTTHRNVLLEEVASQITRLIFQWTTVSIEDLGRNKSDGSNLLSNVLAVSVIAPSLENSSRLARCPSTWIHSLLKDPSSPTVTCRPIALVPNLRKMYSPQIYIGLAF